jgi:hypothetical protein
VASLCALRLINHVAASNLVNLFLQHPMLRPVENVDQGKNPKAPAATRAVDGTGLVSRKAARREAAIQEQLWRD